MEIKPAVLGVVTVLYLFGLHGPGEAADMTCKEVVQEIGKRQVSGVGACSKELNFKNAKDKKERATCILKCVMQREKVLNSDGKFDMKAIEEMVETTMPANLGHLRERGEAMFNNCKNLHEPNLDNADPQCKSYGPLIKCLMGIMTLCKE